MSTVRLPELHNETPDRSRYSVAGVDSKKADGGIRLLPARITLHARAGAEVAREARSPAR